MFIFKTKIDSSKIAKFSKFEIYSIIPKVAIISVFLLLISIIHFFQRNTGLAIFWLALSVSYLPITYLTSYIATKKNAKLKLIGFENIEETYTFDENSVLISQTDGGEINLTSTLNYTNFFAIYKTKTDYILYLSKTDNFIFPIESITQGDIAKFDEFLKSKLGKSFVIKKYSL